MNNPLHLYSPADVAKIRKLLVEEQNGLDALTGLELPDKQQCLDHSHQTQYVRAVLHRQVNAALGKLEGIHTRYLSYWYTGSLPDFLRLAADYLERPDDERYIHPGFLKKLQTMFNTLPEGSKRAVLEEMKQPQGGNAAERKKLFRKALLTRKYTYNEIRSLIDSKRKNT